MQLSTESGPATSNLLLVQHRSEANTSTSTLVAVGCDAGDEAKEGEPAAMKTNAAVRIIIEQANRIVMSKDCIGDSHAARVTRIVDTRLSV